MKQLFNLNKVNKTQNEKLNDNFLQSFTCE